MKIQYSIQLLFFFVVFITKTTQGQVDINYQMPPKAIADLADAPLTPAVMLSPNGTTMLIMERPSMPSIEEVAQEELRLAGTRINPKTNGTSRTSYFTSIVIKSVTTGQETMVIELPKQPKIENLSWSPDGSKIAFTHTTDDGIELWTADLKTATAKRLTAAIINDAVTSNAYTWLADSKTIICNVILTERQAPPKPSAVPKGPVVQVNDGVTAPVRTYQDLLKNKYDEALFSYYSTARLLRIDTQTAQVTPFGLEGIIKSFSASPDGNYLLIYTVHPPFSYIVPYTRFPYSVDIYDKTGRLVRNMAKIPLTESIPIGFNAVPVGARNFMWRADHPASLYWVEALDGGDPKKEVELRDQLFSLAAPFTGTPQKEIAFQLRYGGITWGDDNLAIAYESWWQSRQVITSAWQPKNSASGKVRIFDRSSEDSYNAPGAFELEANAYGRYVLKRGSSPNILYLVGQGASPEGNRPFIDEFDLNTKNSKRLWRSEAPYYEVPIDLLDIQNGIVLTRRESNTEPPNFFIRNLIQQTEKQITNFPNPYESLKGVKKEIIRYQRSDGIELTGTLYLPANYDKTRDGSLPVFMWAYPREFKSKDAAGQVNDSPYEFIRLGWGTPIYWVTRGYAVFDDFSMPIVGESDEEPNETFIEQLRDGAASAINKLVEMGVADRNRIGVGGHSYGAFMTANLLAHTDLFAAGIARSGAYNRTLTPFGFQAEERTYWQAPEIYHKMSPFNYSDTLKTPLLLIHGEADNNPGTFPMQSERFYTALKGHGATVRLVLLPHESHGYRARESVMHQLWEMDTWLEKYVKNRGVERP